MNSATGVRNFVLAPAALAMLGSWATNVLAADKLVDVGKFECEGACAAFHGPAGSGNGPFMMQLATKLPDPSMLAGNHSGLFPFDRVYPVIDGRQVLKAHGTREMPIWGRAFRMQSSAFFENYPAGDPGSSARSRILALIEYVYRLQAN